MKFRKTDEEMQLLLETAKPQYQARLSQPTLTLTIKWTEIWEVEQIRVGIYKGSRPRLGPVDRLITRWEKANTVGV